MLQLAALLGVPVASDAIRPCSVNGNMDLTLGQVKGAAESRQVIFKATRPGLPQARPSFDSHPPRVASV